MSLPGNGHTNSDFCSLLVQFLNHVLVYVVFAVETVRNSSQGKFGLYFDKFAFYYGGQFDLIKKFQSGFTKLRVQSQILLKVFTWTRFQIDLYFSR